MTQCSNAALEHNITSFTKYGLLLFSPIARLLNQMITKQAAGLTYKGIWQLFQEKRQLCWL
jgi:hypothetical protein